MSSEKIKETFYESMTEITNQIRKNADSINKNDLTFIIDLILLMRNTKNKVFIYGAGRSGFVGRCFAQRLMHLGIDTCFISDAMCDIILEECKDVNIIVGIAVNGIPYATFIADLLDEQEKGRLPYDLLFLWDSIGSVPSKMSVEANKNNPMWNAGAMSQQFGNFINQKNCYE
jgi:hypothetical protein